MYSKSKKLKSLVFITSLAVTASMATLSGFAVGPAEDPLGVQWNVSPHPRIFLDGAGDYTLVGVEGTDPTSTDRHFIEDENIDEDILDGTIIVPPDEYIQVYADDTIVISPEVNECDITMENVKIYIDDSAFVVNEWAVANLTLMGDNVLMSRDSSGINVDDNGYLKITRESQGSLQVYGQGFGIESEGHLSIQGGEIMADGLVGGIGGKVNIPKVTIDAREGAQDETAFDKELSDDTVSSVAAPEKTSFNTSWFEKNKLSLICISLGLIAIAAIVVYRKKSA